MRSHGQSFGTDIIARIRTTISESLETTCSGLSRQVYEWLDWCCVNGNLLERDHWIGWSSKMRRDNLHKIASNSRFLLMPGVGVPHLASHVLGLAARAVADDLQHRYGYTPGQLESFVDESHYAGS